MIQQNHILVHIKLFHEVPYGKAVYILGNCQQLGDWRPSPSTRLDWTQNNNWRKSLVLPKISPFQYKYVVGDYNQPNNSALEWQTGSNRIINFIKDNSNQTHLIEKWNILRLKIVLCTPSNVDEVSISGNCPDLGMKISKVKLSQKNDSKILNEQSEENLKVWSIQFDLSKYKKCLNYYYFAKINGEIKSTREPGKHYFTDNNHDGDNLLGRIDVEYLLGKIVIVQFQNFKGFKITKLSDQLFIGPYIKNIEDIQVLNENGVKAVLNLQTKEDMGRYDIDWTVIKEQTSEFGIESFNFQIIDMNFFDFIKKAAEALKLLRNILKQYNSVYVHCTAGVFRSPQLVILYLVKFMNYNLNDAFALIKNKRPFIHPYIEGIRNILNNVYNQFKVKKI